MAQQKLMPRIEISDAYKWRLEDIYVGEDEWEKEFKGLEELLNGADRYRGKLKDAGTIASCLDWMYMLSQGLGEVYAYARMRRDEDNTNSCYQALTDRAGTLAVRVGSAISFVVPELMSLSDEQITVTLEDPLLGPYAHMLEDILRKRSHVLSLAEEKLLAEAGELAEAPGTIFTMANNADLKFPLVQDDKGEMVELTKGNYIRFMENSDRRLRRDAFAAFYGTYQKQLNTWGATLNASVKADIFFAKARKYSSAIEVSLDDDNVPLGVYDSLIESVHEFLPVMHKYTRLRKKVLGLDELHMYDIYVPLVADAAMDIPYEQAKEMVKAGLEPLGAEYLEILETGFNSSWIDVYENEGKTSGAYSWGTFRSHPYVLLNHQDTLDSMFTLAHEMGHSLHTHLSHRKQPYPYSGYKIFVAEVASTLNETLVMDHLLKTTKDPKVLAYLLNHYLEQFRGTVFRQTMFAEFEREIHRVVEQGGALTAENLSEIYRKLNELYYGPDVVIDPEISCEWIRISHFYSAFYVYKYATGFSAATALARKILQEGEPAVQRYLDFLGGGSSDYPIELLRKAGVDMETPEPVREALTVFSELVDKLEVLLLEQQG